MIIIFKSRNANDHGKTTIKSLCLYSYDTIMDFTLLFASIYLNFDLTMNILLL